MGLLVSERVARGASGGRGGSGARSACRPRGTGPPPPQVPLLPPSSEISVCVHVKSSGVITGNLKILLVFKKPNRTVGGRLREVNDLRVCSNCKYHLSTCMKTVLACWIPQRVLRTPRVCGSYFENGRRTH